MNKLEKDLKNVLVTKVKTELCKYSDLNEQGEIIANGRCVGCRRTNYLNCKIYETQEWWGN